MSLYYFFQTEDDFDSDEEITQSVWTKPLSRKTSLRQNKIEALKEHSVPTRQLTANGMKTSSRDFLPSYEEAIHNTPAPAPTVNLLTDKKVNTKPRKLSVVFNKKIRIEGAWNFALAELGKLHYIVNEDGTRQPMPLSYELAREKRLQRQVFNKWRHYKRKPDVTSCDDKKGWDFVVEASQAGGSGGAKRGCMLPWWCGYILLLLVALITVTCAFFTILYTFNFGTDKSIGWACALLTSLVSDVFINQPILIILTACVLTFIFKRNQLEKLHVDVNTTVDINENTDNEKYRITTEKQAISMLKLDPIYRPPRNVSYHTAVSFTFNNLSDMGLLEEGQEKLAIF